MFSQSATSLAALLACAMLLQSSVAGQDKPQDSSATPSVTALGKRRMDLEQQIERVESKTDPASALRLRNLQEQLLQVTGEEDAARQQLPRESKGIFGKPSFISIPVYYITDRARGSAGKFGGVLRDHGLEYGRSNVTLGTDLGVRVDLIAGAHNLPQGHGIQPPTLQNTGAMRELLDAIGSSGIDPRGHRKRVLLFVHGYNVSFDDAVTAAARLATEVEFPVIPVAYSWPSDGTYVGYWHDEEIVRDSSSRFRNFLQELLTKSPTDVVIVCHSMGAREVTSALAELGHHGVQLPALHKVVFAAADIWSKEFMDTWPDLQKLEGVEFAFYVSNHDLALRLSHIVHKLPRLGDADPTITAPFGGITVDASAVDSVFQAAGHSYILNAPKIGADLGAWVDGDTSPKDRGLLQIVRAGQSYYMFP